MSRKWVLRVTFVLGFLLLCYPLVSSKMQSKRQEEAVNTYKQEVSDKSEEEIQKMRADAIHYNDVLFQCQGAIVDNADTGVLSDDSYNSLLLQSDTGVMGSIEIPKIDVDLPIFHGTSDEVLSVSIGHQQGTSLPVGGENSHVCLTGHRGLPGAKLFTRLDEMVSGDLFFINVLGETMAYKVYDVRVVEPSEAETFVATIDSGKDIVTLVTCTPYGLNTHRLLVSGERVPYEKAEYDSISSTLPSIREILFTALPFILLVIVGILKFKDWRKSKHHDEKKDS